MSYLNVWTISPHLMSLEGDVKATFILQFNVYIPRGHQEPDL